MAKITRKYLSCDVIAYNQIIEREFTYHIDTNTPVAIGMICLVKFGKQTSLAIIRGFASSKPAFNTKPIEKIISLPSVLPPNLLKLADWLKSYYVATNYQVYKTILPTNLKAKSTVKTTAYHNPKPDSLNKLSPQQQSAMKIITKSNSKPYLLHGTTGSGKTELYLHVINQTIQEGRSSILLVPEIFLSTQLSERIKSYFQNVIITHSGLTPAIRKSQWRYVLSYSNTTPIVVVGPRSAIFTPLKNLGTIIIDEEHEPSYKQESGLRYDTISTAAKRAQLDHAKLILGSATPSLRTHFLTTKQKITTATLQGRFESQLPEVKIVDMKKSNQILSPELNSAISKTLKSNSQALLLLNRRGSSQALVCKHCHFTFRCSRCEIAMHYHADKNRLVCHYCNKNLIPPSSCPQCQSLEIRHIGFGTKKLEIELKSEFKNASIARIDKDNSDWQHLQDSYKSLKSGKIDILIGTQMISRGLDVAGIELVGIIDADSSFQIADYNSSERCFQLLTQVAGRSGRRKTQGQVIIQTKVPQSEIITAVKDHNYQGFVNSELHYRKKFAYPPYVYLLKLWSTQKNQKNAFNSATKLADKLSAKNVIILGPAPKSATANSIPSWQIIVKSYSRTILQDLIPKLPTKWKYEFDPITLL